VKRTVPKKAAGQSPSPQVSPAPTLGLIAKGHAPRRSVGAKPALDDLSHRTDKFLLQPFNKSERQRADQPGLSAANVRQLFARPHRALGGSTATRGRVCEVVMDTNRPADVTSECTPFEPARLPHPSMPSASVQELSPPPEHMLYRGGFYTL